MTRAIDLRGKDKKRGTTSSSRGKNEGERLSAASFALVADRTTTRECSSGLGMFL